MSIKRSPKYVNFQFSLNENNILTQPTSLPVLDASSFKNFLVLM